MESGGSSSLGLKKKGKKTDRNRRAWTPVEEDVLVGLMKDLVAKGWKTENGFKPGYLLKLEAGIVDDNFMMIICGFALSSNNKSVFLHVRLGRTCDRGRLVGRVIASLLMIAWSAMKISTMGHDHLQIPSIILTPRLIAR
ncbi:hypothetical protein ACS0TY_019465 [Phlomoides rotata]